MLEVALQSRETGRVIGTPFPCNTEEGAAAAARQMREAFPDEQKWDVVVSGEQESFEQRVDRMLALAMEG